MDAPNLQLCRICITNSNCAQMISIFGEDSLWKKITLLADVQIEKDDTLPQQVCITCAKNAISACLFKKKCEDADNFYRQQLLIRKIEGKNSSKVCGNDVITLSEEEASENEQETEDNRHNNDTDNDEDDGEIKMENEGKPPNFDFNSIRLMHEYMQQHLSKINGNHSGSGSDALGDDDEPLPLIPEIELLTPAEEVNTNAMTTNAIGNNNAQLRGYQCTNCYQIFEMKQLLKHHMQTVHGTSGPVYECSNCKKTYFYKRFLEKHVRRGRCVKKRRNQTRPMQCSDCHVLFPTGHHLGWHKRTGCPSRAAKMPLQQLFKQNIVQYNNFPKRIGIRKPENAIYLHNRKLIMANNKRKGRTRIKLDAKKIALAKQLILREATTTVIANELNISRTFAWRLRKSLVNGVSLHERVIDPTTEEHADEQQQPEPREQQPQNFQNDETVCIKSEQMDSGSSEDEEEVIEEEQNVNNVNNNGHNSIKSYESTHVDNEVDEDDFDNDNDDDDDDDGDEDDVNSMENDNDAGDIEHGDEKPINCKKQQIYLEQRNNVPTEQAQVAVSDSSERSHISNNFKVYSNTERQQELNFKNGLPQALPMLNGFPAAVAAAIHHLPVNLSIKPIASLQNTESNSQLKKPRKPNVFIDDEKYAMAKMLVAQNSSTMEIARQLNVSQMTAWKVRDAIVKGIPLSYRSKRELRATMMPDTLQSTAASHSTHPHQQQQMHHQHLIPIPHPIQQSQQHTAPPSSQRQRDTVPAAPPAPAQPSTISGATKSVNPRRRLKAAERELRDKEITREILEMIKEDSNIQYWKVSARLAEKGYPISPSSVCQKLKSMGIHRRWKPGDKPPMLDLEQLKANGVVGPTTETDESFDYNNPNEQQFDLGGAHFLSAFTR